MPLICSSAKGGSMRLFEQVVSDTPVRNGAAFMKLAETLLFDTSEIEHFMAAVKRE